MIRAYKVKMAIDKPVFLKRNPVKNANMRNENSWMKNPPAKLIFLNIIVIPGLSVLTMPRIKVPRIRMKVMRSEIRKISCSFERRNSWRLMPFTIFCRIVLLVNSFVIRMMITVAGSIRMYLILAKKVIFCQISGKK
jgi:hypothetical protein